MLAGATAAAVRAGHEVARGPWPGSRLGPPDAAVLSVVDRMAGSNDGHRGTSAPCPRSCDETESRSQGCGPRHGSPAFTEHSLEVLRLYSNLQSGQKRLQNVRSTAISELREPAQAVLRLQMNRLDAVAVTELIAGYRAGARANQLAQRFGVHRHTVAALLRRNGVELRAVGMSTDQVTDACCLYRDGWSLSRLGESSG